MMLGIWGRTIYFDGNEWVSLLDEIGCKIAKHSGVLENSLLLLSTQHVQRLQSMKYRQNVLQRNEENETP